MRVSYFLTKQGVVTLSDVFENWCPCTCVQFTFIYLFIVGFKFDVCQSKMHKSRLGLTDALICLIFRWDPSM